MAQHFIPERRWRSRSKVGQFATRQEAHQRSKRTYLCQSCLGWNDATKKPPRCRWCGYASFYRCDSTKEAQHFIKLVERQQYHEISDLEHHPRFPILLCDNRGKNWKQLAYYEADVKYIRDGNLIVEDVKATTNAKYHDPVFKLKKRLVEHFYGVEIAVIA